MLKYIMDGFSCGQFWSSVHKSCPHALINTSFLHHKCLKNAFLTLCSQPTSHQFLLDNEASHLGVVEILTSGSGGSKLDLHSVGLYFPPHSGQRKTFLFTFLYFQERNMFECLKTLKYNRVIDRNYTTWGRHRKVTWFLIIKEIRGDNFQTRVAQRKGGGGWFPFVGVRVDI